MAKRRFKQYQDQITELYKDHPLAKAGKQLTYNITFQVTDACNLQCSYCVSGDTLILMADNSYKRIDEIVEGEQVLTFDEYPDKDCALAPATVTHTFKREAVVCEVSLESGKRITITPNHKVLTPNNEYIAIEDLQIGDSICQIVDGKINNSNIIYKSYKDNCFVYNLETEAHTYIANNICVHNCYQINKHTNVMSFDVAKRFIDLLLDPDPDSAEYIDSRNSIACIIEFIGGEPFLQIELIDQISDYFIKRMIETNHPWQYNHRFSICSNGTLYFDPKVQAYFDKHKEDLSFNISIDGNKKLHDACRVFPDGSGSYDKAMAAVRDWVDNRHGYMGSKMTLAPSNIMYTKEAVIGLIDSGYEEINLNCIFEEGWTEEHATILYNQLIELSDYVLENNLEDKLEISIFSDFIGHRLSEREDSVYCGGSGKMISVDYKGDIYPCIRYMESSLGDDIPPIIIGNVYNGIMQTQCEKDCVHCMRAITRLTESTEECINCPIASGCAECMGYNYQNAGGQWNHRATYICIMHKARVLANCYYWNLKFWKNKENKRFKLWLSDEEALKIISQEQLDFLKNLQFPIE